MLSKIKELADEAIKLQNKNRMDEVLREISAMCTLLLEVKIEKVCIPGVEKTIEQFSSKKEIAAPAAKKQHKGKADE